MLGMSILGNLIVVDELTVSKLLKNTEKKMRFWKISNDQEVPKHFHFSRSEVSQHDNTFYIPI